MHWVTIIKTIIHLHDDDVNERNFGTATERMIDIVGGQYWRGDSTTEPHNNKNKNGHGTNKRKCSSN